MSYEQHDNVEFGELLLLFWAGFVKHKIFEKRYFSSHTLHLKYPFKITHFY